MGGWLTVVTLSFLFLVCYLPEAAVQASGVAGVVDGGGEEIGQVGVEGLALVQPIFAIDSVRNATAQDQSGVIRGVEGVCS